MTDYSAKTKLDLYEEHLRQRSLPINSHSRGSMPA